jgi:hypothetical protein
LDTGCAAYPIRADPRCLREKGRWLPLEKRKVIIFLIALLVMFVLLAWFAPKAM